MTIDLTIPSYIILGVVVYYAVLFTLSARRRHPEPLPPAAAPCFVIVVPARNEALVLDDTLANLTELSYPGRYLVLVMDDASSDTTAAIATDWTRRDHRIRLVQRSDAQGGMGKSDVLNHAYQTINGWIADGDPALGAACADEVVLGIVDADGRLEPRRLEEVAPYFADPSVGSTQIGVRIANADRSLLARMQDMEFVAFTWLVQIARDRIGSSGLGGNGQFTRLAALRSVGGQPWAPEALTEDLDLGLSLVERGWRTKFCPRTHVDQQGLEQWKPLLRQRTRWIQGHYQCWRHLPKLLRSRHASLAARIDLALYLLLVVTVVLVTTTLLLALAGTFGLLAVTNNFLIGAIPAGYPYRIASFTISVLPLSIFMYSYQRHSTRPFRAYEVPAAAAVFTLYTYVWFYATARAWARLATHRTAWVKTPRIDPGPAPVIP